MRPYYARWTDTGRPVYRLSRAGHLKKASAPVTGAVLPPFVRSSNRRRNGCAFVNPHGNDVVPVREAPVPRRPGPASLFQTTAPSGQKKLSAANPAGKVSWPRSVPF